MRKEIGTNKVIKQFQGCYQKWKINFALFQNSTCFFIVVKIKREFREFRAILCSKLYFKRVDIFMKKICVESVWKFGKVRSWYNHVFHILQYWFYWQRYNGSNWRHRYRLLCPMTSVHQIWPKSLCKSIWWVSLIPTMGFMAM